MLPKGKSRTGLSQRRWSLVTEKGLPPSRNTSDSQKGLVESKQLRNQLSQQRPLSPIPSRPESRASRPPSRAASRLDSRPPSRLDSRPPSRLDSRPPSRLDSRPVSTLEAEIIQRPKSGTVRPLSGRVFMRRTSEKGWVAKAYPHPPSQTDLDIFDDLSADSFDSFFDDDFDSAHQEDKLHDLLNCNTLGVESQARKPDWNAGNVEIPQFHCPRCRDHWYSLTPFPCDEELARLIREGLWYTGKGDPTKTNRTTKNSVLRRPESGRKEFGSSSTDSLTLPHIKNRRLQNVSENERDLLTREFEGNGTKKKKSRKRISFKLDAEGEDGSQHSLDDGEGDSGSLARGFRGKGGSGLGLDVGADLDSTGSLNSTSLGKGREGIGGSSGDVNDTTSSDSTRSGTDRHSRARGSNSSNLTAPDSSTDLDGTKSRRRSQRGKGGSGGLFGSESDLDQDRTGSGGDGNSQSRRLENGILGNRNGTLGGGETGSDGSRKHGLGTSGQDGSHSGSISGARATQLGSSNGEVNTSNSSDAHRGFDRDEASSSLRGSETSLHSSSRSGGGRDRNPIGTEDHGRRVRRAVGYMRAVSPSQSEWGDPLHARSFISSTAASRTGSTSNLLRDCEEDKSEEISLPPVVPAITNKQPLIDLSDLIGGFQVTRAWTFSYHNPGPLTAKIGGVSGGGKTAGKGRAGRVR